MSLVSIFLFISQAAFAGEASPLIDPDAIARAGSFLVLPARDCATLYIAPLTYTLDSERSYVLPFSRDGENWLEINLALKAKVTPDETDLAKIMKSSRKHPPATCKSGAATIVPYAWPRQHLYSNRWANERIYNLETYASGDETQIVHLNFNRTRAQISDILFALKTLSFTKRISLSYLHTYAQARLSGNYQATADFFKRSFTLKSCTYIRDCDKIFGIATNSCEPTADCAYTPVEVQQLERASLQDGITFKSSAEAGYEDQALQLMSRLMSRFAVSAFMEQKRYALNDVVTVWLDQATKAVTGTYEDHLSVQAIGDINYDNGVEIQQLIPYLEKQLRSVYARN